MEIISFIVKGEIKGNDRPRARVISTLKGSYAQFYTTQKDRSAKTSILASYLSAYKEKYGNRCESILFEPKTPIRAKIDIAYGLLTTDYTYYKKTKSTTINKSGIRKLNGLERPTKKPDIDNIIKLIFDALNKVAYHDDNQIVDVEVHKFYAENGPYMEIELQGIDL